MTAPTPFGHKLLTTSRKTLMDYMGKGVGQ
jgi:hypothetical protein